jgi:hypothetical protein
MESVDSCLRPKDSINSLYEKKNRTKFFEAFYIIRFILMICIIFQVTALLGTLELQDSAKTQGSFCSVQLFGAWSYQIQQCIAGLLQSISGENISWQSSLGHCHD